MVDRFSSHIHIKADGLHGWCVACPADERHRALQKSVHEVGYPKTIDRLDLIANLSKRSNPHLHRVAREDLGYLERWHHERERKEHEPMEAQ